MKLASCVTPSSYVKTVVNVKNAVTNPPVGARLQSFWQVWLDLGSSHRVVRMLRSGYILPFQNRPFLSRHPTVISRYVNHRRNSYLSEALHQLISKNAVEPVQNPKSLGFFNRLFLVPKPNNKWRPILDLSNLNPFLKVEKFKMETPETIRTSLQRGEWVTSIDFTDAYFHVPIQEQSRKYLRFHVQGQTYQFKALPFGLSTAPLEFTVIAKEVKLMAMHRGIRIHQYLDDWLVRANSHPACLQHTRDLLKICQDLGWLVNKEKSELEPKQVFDFVGYQFDLESGRVRPTPDRWQTLTAKIQAILARPTCPVVHVLDRSPNGHRKAGLSRPPTHEARAMAPQEQLEGTGIIRKVHSHTRFSTSTSKMVVGGKQCVARTTSTPTKPCSADLYRRIKRRVGRSLRRTHSQRRVVPTGKQTAHQLPRVESSLSGAKRVSKPLFRQDSTGGHRQHHSSVLHQQRRWHEVGPSVCSSVENFDLVYDQPSNPQSPSHPGPAKCGSGQAIQTRPDYSDGMVSPHRNLSGDMLQVAPTSGGPLRHEVQQQTASVCVTGAGSLSDCSRCTQHTLGEPGCLRFPTSGHLGQSSGKITELPRQQDNSDCSGVAQHALVLGPGGHVQPNPIEPSQRATPDDTALQSDPSQKSDKSKSPRMAPRSAIADKLGNVTLNISKDDNLTRLLDSFHRDRPKGRRGIPSWNLSLVLHQLTKAPFEPLREASLKHLTFKTVFLLALGSGKRRSEIHAWQNKNIRHQSDWSKVSLFPSPSFLSKNQLAKEGPESVAPVVIPALAPTLDRSLKSDRSLCLVRALRYYLDRTSDIRQGKELVFVSFKKSFDKDISPATISSWIKQTVILCYELSDHQAHTLHQVKAHDVRAFAASKAFQSGVSLEQILSACHWKSHNTFTQFYLKDVAWADSELYHLGPVVAAQQIHQQANT